MSRLRIVPSRVELPDGSVHGADAVHPALVLVHWSGAVEVWSTVNPPEPVRVFLGEVVDLDLSQPWGAAVLDMNTAGGVLKVGPGPGCACGSVVKSLRPVDPGAHLPG